MPQENQVLQCFSCETFQVHIVKKAKKWDCKVCGAKQSFKRHYGKGSGKDCRNHVIKLNELRGLRSHSANVLEDETCEKISETELALVEQTSASEPVFVQEKKISKWAQYLDEDSDSGNEDSFYNASLKRKINEESGRGNKISKKLAPNTDSFNHIQSNGIRNSKFSKYVEVDEGLVETKKSKTIFDSDLDKADDFLNFINLSGM